MELTREDFKILEIEINWDSDGTYYEYWIEKRIWYFFKLFKSNQFRLMLNHWKDSVGRWHLGDAPLNFNTREEAEKYIQTLIK